jgi:hypothetical protein
MFRTFGLGELDEVEVELGGRGRRAVGRPAGDGDGRGRGAQVEAAAGNAQGRVELDRLDRAVGVLQLEQGDGRGVAVGLVGDGGGDPGRRVDGEHDVPDPGFRAEEEDVEVLVGQPARAGVVGQGDLDVRRRRHDARPQLFEGQHRRGRPAPGAAVTIPEAADPRTGRTVGHGADRFRNRVRSGWPDCRQRAVHFFPGAGGAANDQGP